MTYIEPPYTAPTGKAWAHEQGEWTLADKPPGFYTNAYGDITPWGEHPAHCSCSTCK